MHSPKIIGVICFICLISSNYVDKIIKLSDFTNNCAVLFSTFAGFLFTALSIMLTFPEKSSVKIMKSSGAYKGVLFYILVSIKWCLLSLIASLFSYFFEGIYIKYLYCVVLSIYLASIVSLFRIIILLSKVIDLVAADNR